MNKIRLTITIGIFATISLAGCASRYTVVQDRAAYDLKCSRDGIEVMNIGGESYAAKGCKQEAVYNCQSVTKFLFPLYAVCSMESKNQPNSLK